VLIRTRGGHSQRGLVKKSFREISDSQSDSSKIRVI